MLPNCCVFNNFEIGPGKHKVFTNKARYGSDSDWSEVIKGLRVRCFGEGDDMKFSSHLGKGGVDDKAKWCGGL